MSVHIAPRTLVESFLPFEGEVPLAQVYDVASLAGLDDQPVRLAIRRLVAAGDVVQQGRGRAGTLTLTDAGRGRLQRDRQSLALALAQDSGEARWDGSWLLISVSAPEVDRQVRDSLRRELLALGAAAISTGLYASPHDLRGMLSAESVPYVATATTRDLLVQGVHDPLTIAEMLWPGAPIVAAYRNADDALGEASDTAAGPKVVRLLVLAQAVENAMRDDPLIPAELRTGTWPPTTIRQEWARRWDELSTDAEAAIFSGWFPPVWTSV